MPPTPERAEQPPGAHHPDGEQHGPDQCRQRDDGGEHDEDPGLAGHSVTLSETRRTAALSTRGTAARPRATVAVSRVGSVAARVAATS